MAKRIEQKPGLLLKYPMLSQWLAMAGGGAVAAHNISNGGDARANTAVGLLPLAIVQMLKRKRINDIDDDYQTAKRKRLRDVGGEDTMDGTVGSHRLGMTQAYEAMRTRKLKRISAISEGADALPVASHMLGLGPAASLPITQLIDHIEAGRMLKRASDDPTDQRNTPAIAMYIAAAMASGVIGKEVGKTLLNQMREGRGMPRDEWEGAVRHISGRPLVTINAPGLNNAQYEQADSPERARQLAFAASMDPHNFKHVNWLSSDPTRKLREGAMRDGITTFDPLFGKPGVVGHEAGHGRIQHEDGLVGKLQRNLYRYSPAIAPLSAVGSMAAGLASGSTLKGLLAGTGIGLLGSAGMMVPEAMASYHGLKGMKSYKGGRFADKDDFKRQLTALGSYGSMLMLPSMLSGAFGGYVSGRRKKKEAEEGAVVRRDEDAEDYVEEEGV